MELDYIIKLVGARKNKIKKVHILPLAIDEKCIVEPEPSESFRVCWWGTFIPLHGLENIIEAFQIIKVKYPKQRITLDLFGVPGKLAEHYSSFVKGLKLNDSVRVHTNKTFANGLLEEHLKTKCDLALGTFGDSEKAKIVFCNKIVDAFAMKIPVITMDSPALKEFVEPRSDLFVCGNSPQEIAEIISNLNNDKNALEKIGRAGHNIYLQTFSPNQYIEGVVSLLSQEK
jgi:glycosyltransferase involved in cell wall biosynthesis